MAGSQLKFKVVVWCSQIHPSSISAKSGKTLTVAPVSSNALVVIERSWFVSAIANTVETQLHLMQYQRQ
jgi:hypothetical protein